ncbi:MAG: hypothetical protein R3D65_12365 [Zhengella sp.]|uniref:hypothetical protein n=1 Tax=Zhengella sp. TaxID=2282762 RepID=UPI001D8F9785|nr:hypothetical protein [Notoacmeibacter sp.]MCC0027397.1 hypothetical protein [Brucellaceae bacterium]
MSARGRLPFLAALRAGRPGWRLAVAGTAAWALALAASAAAGLAMHGWSWPDMQPAVLLFFCGGFLAFPLAVWLAGFLDAWLAFRPGQRFASVFILLGMGSVALTALIFSQVFRHYFSGFHGPFGSKLWLIQTIFTSAAAIYHFLVMGLRLFLPLGLPALLLAALLLARRPALSKGPPGANSTHPQESTKDRSPR